MWVVERHLEMAQPTKIIGIAQNHENEAGKSQKHNSLSPLTDLLRKIYPKGNSFFVKKKFFIF